MRQLFGEQNRLNVFFAESVSMRKAPASFKYLFSSQLIEDWNYRLPETQRKEESQVLGSIASHLTTRCTKAYGAYHKWKRQKIPYCWSTRCPAEHKLTVQFETCLNAPLCNIFDKYIHTYLWETLQCGRSRTKMQNEM